MKSASSREDRSSRRFSAIMLAMVCLMVAGAPLPFITLYYPISYHLQTGIWLVAAAALYGIVHVIKRGKKSSASSP